MKARPGLQLIPLILLIALVLIALVLVVLVAGCGSDGETRQSASADEQAVIAKFLATSPGDSVAQAALWTEDAILEDYSANTTAEGRQHIIDYLSENPTNYFEASGRSIKLDDYIVQPTNVLQDENLIGHGVLVFEITGDGLIKHLWISGAED